MSANTDRYRSPTEIKIEQMIALGWRPVTIARELAVDDTLVTKVVERMNRIANST